MSRRSAVAGLVASVLLASGCASGDADPIDQTVVRRPLVDEGSITSDLVEPETVGLKVVLGALKKPLESILGETATSVVMDLVFGPEPKDYTAQLDAIQADLAKLNALEVTANDRLVFIEQMLRITETDIEAVAFSNALIAPTTAIETPYSGSASGAIDGCDPNTAMRASLCWFYSSNHTAEEKRSNAHAFLRSMKPKDIIDALAQLSLLVVPNDPTAKTLLDNYADLVATRLDPTALGVADAIDAIEGRFLSLLRTQVHGMQLIVAYYQMQVATSGLGRATADEEIAAALTGIGNDFARQADAYLRAIARYAAVAGGDPRFLVVDPATGAPRIAAQLQAKLSRAPAIADAVRHLATNPTRGAGARPATSDLVHAFFLARLTDDAFSEITVTATDVSDLSRTKTATVQAKPTLGALSDRYSDPGAGYVMHTTNGRYGVFTTVGGPMQLTLNDGWMLYEINLELPGHSTASLDLVVATTAGIGGKRFGRRQALQPAFPADAGEPSVYVAADDFRADGPTSRVDLWSWGAATTAVPKTCSCQDFDSSANPSGPMSSCPNGLAPQLTVDAATGVQVSIAAYTGNAPDKGVCTVQQAVAMAATVRDAAPNAIVYAVTEEQRQGDVVAIGARRVVFPTPTLGITCANNQSVFSDPAQSTTASTNVAFSGQAVGGSVNASVFTSTASLACQQAFYSEPGWGHLDTTVWADAVDALADSPATTWTGTPTLALSKPLALTTGQDGTVTVSAGFEMPGRFQKVGAQTRLLGFGVYAP